MPNSKQAVKRLRQAKVRNLRNRMAKSEIKTHTKKVLAAVSEGNTEAAEASLRIAQSKLDKAAQKGVMHKNTVSRRKAQLAAKVGSLKS